MVFHFLLYFWYILWRKKIGRGEYFFKHTSFHIFCLNIYYKYFFNIFWGEVFFFNFSVQVNFF